MRLIFRPLEVWTDPETQNRKPGSFTSSWTDTLRLLDREVDLLGSGGERHTDAVIQVAAPEHAMRIDGGLRADAKVTHPGVVISFEGPSGPLRFACDRFSGGSKWKSGSGYTTIPAWQMNARAIALGLEALRKVARYGIGQGTEQYTGYRQLGSGMPMPAAQMTADVAARLIAHAAGDTDTGAWVQLVDAQARDDAYRRAAKRLHPDAGGSTEDFQRLQEAKRILDGALS